MIDASSVKRRYLALWFPFLPADRWRIKSAGQYGKACTRPPEATGDGHLSDTPLPLAMVAKVRGALLLAAVDARAQALGIVPGMTLADARAMEPDLIVTEMDEGADRHWLERMARHCLDWSPRVTLDPPDGITLDISGVDHLFGGEAELCAQVEDTMLGAGMTLRCTAASTAEAAQALARHGALSALDEQAAIRALPVVALGLDADSTLALNRAGLKRVGDLVTRPAATLAARFGAGAVSALLRLTGEVHAPVDVLADPEPLYFERRFAEPIGLQSTIAQVFLELLREAGGALAERDLGGRHFALTLYRSDGARHRLDIETGRPTRDPALVLRLFDERIASLADPLDPGFGYDRISLFLPATAPLADGQLTWDGEEKDEAALDELIARLSTRFGAGSLCRLSPRESHLPEQAQLALPAMKARGPVPWPRPPAGEPPVRPLFLFDPPQRVEVLAEVPDGPPHRFRWRRKLHEVRLYEGPERIANEWWRHKGGECAGQGGLTRDYYRVEDVRGRRYWLFRHGLYDEKPGPHWYLHGLFA